MRAWDAATRKSHAIASSAPPPSASPFNAAITGNGSCGSLSRVVRMRRAIAAASSAERMCSSSLRSPPAQKALAPAPRITRTRESLRASSMASSSSAMVWCASAFRAWGRLMEIVATPSTTSKMRSRIAGGLAASARTFQTGLRHLAQVQHLVELLLGDATAAGQLANRAPCPDRFLRELRYFVVSDQRIQGGGQHRAALDELRSAIGRLQAAMCGDEHVERGLGVKVVGRFPDGRATRFGKAGRRQARELRMRIDAGAYGRSAKRHAGQLVDRGMRSPYRLFGLSRITS